METLVLLEYETPAPDIRRALLDRIRILSFSDVGRIGFVATEADEGAPLLCEIVAVVFRHSNAARAIVERWRAEGVLPPEVRMRWLRIDTGWLSRLMVPVFP
jgi:hypothetical protein